MRLLNTKVDPDLWGHVRFGLDMLRSHQVGLDRSVLIYL